MGSCIHHLTQSGDGLISGYTWIHSVSLTAHAVSNYSNPPLAKLFSVVIVWLRVVVGSIQTAVPDCQRAASPVMITRQGHRARCKRCEIKCQCAKPATTASPVDRQGPRGDWEPLWSLSRCDLVDNRRPTCYFSRCPHRVGFLPELQALVYDILPSTTAVFSYAIGSRKLSANEQFLVGAQTVVGLLQITQIKQGVSFIAATRFTPAQIKPQSFESRRNSVFLSPGVDGSHVYVRALALSK